jgi:hypothetical protein
MKTLALALVAFFSFSAFSVEIPGAQMRTSEGLPNNTYELMLAPSYTFEPAGAYLNFEGRYQPNDDFGAAVGFGAGEIGFNLGLNGSWYIAPDTANQPAFSITGGLYLNRVSQANYFNVRLLPMVSKNLRTAFGSVTPYGGATITPSFRLSQPANEVSMRAVLGSQFDIRDLNGLKIFSELDVAIANSVTEISIGVTYPFAAL